MTTLDALQAGRGEPRLEEHPAQWIDICSAGHSAVERGFQQSRSAAHKGVVNQVPGRAQSLDEKSWKLGLEAGAVGDLMQRMSVSLLRSPKFVYVNRNLPSGRLELKHRGRSSKLGKAAKFFFEKAAAEFTADTPRAALIRKFELQGLRHLDFLFQHLVYSGDRDGRRSTERNTGHATERD